MEGHFIPKYDLENYGLKNLGTVYWNPSTPALYEEVVRRREGVISHLGPLVVKTGHHTGRSPKDKLIVREPSSEDKIWWGKENRPIEPEYSEKLYKRMLVHLQDRDLFIQDCYAGADPYYRIPIRVITEYAWHNLFARNMFIQIKNEEELRNHIPQFTIFDTPRFHAIPEIEHTNSETFIIVNFAKKRILIGGTGYAGEIKKSVFTILNYLLPTKEKVLSMHSSANIGKDGDVAILFGLSGTGKTTLSADPERRLIGDDEHGWSENGIFNFEGGCYAKVIRLSRGAEPQIYEVTRRFGTVLENVMINFQSRRIDLDDDSLTENTRGAYPLTHIPDAVLEGVGGHPRTIIMLTCDAFGIMPPVAKLSPEQAMYHFLSGYTAKVAGTEMGITEPQATFSACFGAAFMALPPPVYAKLLGEKIVKHKVNCWLVNTGWTGGPYGVGQRMPIAHSRAIVSAVLSDKLLNVPMRTDPLFGLAVPQKCEGVPEEILDTKGTWENPEEYETKARELAARFIKNFEQFAGSTPKDIVDAGPRL